MRRFDRDFTIDVGENGWRWRSGNVDLALPPPSLDAPCQHQNAAAAIAALYALRDRLGWHSDAIASGIANAHVAARLQRFASVPELVIDVAHNPQAARMLAAWLAAHPIRGRTLAVFGVLGDKDVGGIVAALDEAISRWHLASLAADSPRGLDAATLAERVRATNEAADIAGNVRQRGSGADGSVRKRCRGRSRDRVRLVLRRGTGAHVRRRAPLRARLTRQRRNGRV